MRSLALPMISTSRKQEDDDSRMAALTSPYHPTPGHSRNSSGASSTSSPVTPTFSTRSHSRWASSSSSLASTPDSPVNMAKSPLHDLVEDPAERDELPYYAIPEQPAVEPLCICDTPFCEHRQVSVPQSPAHSPSSPEWAPGDDIVDCRPLTAFPSIKRQRSAETFGGKISSRMSRGWPSISSRWRDRRPTTSLSNSSVRSAPPSRTSSAKHSVKQSLASFLEPQEIILPPISQGEDFYSTTTALGIPQPADGLDSFLSSTNYDPIDRQELSSTPLLPPMMAALQSRPDEELHSPLQSPSIATYSTAGSIVDTPISSPVYAGTPTPPLSAKPSYASIGGMRSTPTLRSPTDAPPSIFEEVDYWAIKLGHANFEIYPEPYLPGICDYDSCSRLLIDWETARINYMRHAAHVSEHYGPSSRAYKLTQEKWSEIDSRWRFNLERANAEAEANGKSPTLQCLAETKPMPKMSALVDPQQPDKFPTIDEADIVGPMVQYQKVHRTPSKKANFLKLFTDPASLLGGRSTFGTRR